MEGVEGMRGIKAILLALILIGGLLPAFGPIPVEGQQGSHAWFDFFWQHNGQDDFAMNNTNTTRHLIIRVEGPSFRANLTFKCPEAFFCPVTSIKDIEFQKGQEMIINYSFIAIMNLSNDGEEIRANLTNRTAQINSVASLHIRIVLPISIEILEHCYSSDFTDSGQTSYYSFHWKKDDINFRVRITNNDPNLNFSGFVGASVINYDENGGWLNNYKIFNKSRITLVPLEGITLDFTIQQSYDKKWTSTWIYMRFAPVLPSTNNISRWISHWYLKNPEDPSVIATYVDLYYTIWDGVGLGLKPQSGEGELVGDIWNGTNVMVTAFNGGSDNLKGFSVNLIDRVGSDEYAAQLTSFDYDKYSNRTEVYIGDIAPGDWKSANVTLFSKASGWHTITVQPARGIGRSMSIPMTFHITSGLGLSFTDITPIQSIISYDRPTWKLLEKDVEKGKETTISMQIDNPMSLEGDLSISIYAMGVKQNLKDHHGNGWIDQSVFADIEPKNIRITRRTENVTFRIVPKITGALYLTPQLMVNGKLLLFDNNIDNQFWIKDDNCYEGLTHLFLPSPNDYSLITSTLCIDYHRKEIVDANIIAQNEIGLVVFASLIASAVVSVLDLYRRWKQKRGYLEDKGRSGKSTSKKKQGQLKKTAKKKGNAYG